MKKGKKEILSLYQTEVLPPFWQFRTYTAEEQTKIQNFFKNFDLELKDELKDSIYDNFVKISELLGLNSVHPLLCKNPYRYPVATEIEIIQINNQDSQLQETKQVQRYEDQLLHSESKEQFDSAINFQTKIDYQTKDHKFLTLKNSKLDYLTLEIIKFCIQNSTHKFIKFCNNEFDQDSCQKVIEIIQNLPYTLQSLHFEWNPLQNQHNFYQKIKISQLQKVVLRANFIQNDISDLIFEQLLITDCKVKLLDLSDNQISSLEKLSIVLKQNQSLECIVLSHNKFASLDVILPISMVLNKIYLSEQEKFQLDQEQDAKNKKKKKNEEDIKLYETDEIGSYIQGNVNLKKLIFDRNNFEDNSLQALQKFIARIDKETSLLSLQFNRFSEIFKSQFKQCKAIQF